MKYDLGTRRRMTSVGVDQNRFYSRFQPEPSFHLNKIDDSRLTAEGGEGAGEAGAIAPASPLFRLFIESNHPILKRYVLRKGWQIRKSSLAAIQEHLFNPLTSPSPLAMNMDCIVYRSRISPKIIQKTLCLEIYENKYNITLEHNINYIVMRKEIEIISLPKILFIRSDKRNIGEKQITIGPVFSNAMFITYRLKTKGGSIANQKNTRFYSAWERLIQS